MVETIRVGTGFDVHALVPGRPLLLGGIQIEHERGLLGFSDADVLLHAITDALLGAAGLGDIGRMFPDTDPRRRGRVIRDLRVRNRAGSAIAAGFWPARYLFFPLHRPARWTGRSPVAGYL